MKKVCFFNSDSKWGGGVKFYLDFAIGMKQLGYTVIGYCAPGSILSKQYTKANILVRSVRVNNRSAFNPFKVAKVLGILKKDRVDIIMFTNSEDLKLGALAAKLAGIPKIIYRRGLAVPIRNRWTNRFIFKNLVTHILANSEETKKTILQNLSGVIRTEDIRVIYNGLTIHDTAPNPFTIIERYPRNGIILGNAGRLVPQKGQLLLIDIAEKLKAKGLSFTLFIAGAGELQTQLEQAIKDKHLADDVHLIGYVDNIAGFMRAIDVFLLTSLWEGFGYVLSEAAIQKKPSIAFDVSSNPEIIDSGKTGLLVPVNNVNAFAEAIIQLAENKTLRTTFGNAAFEKVSRQFELKRQIQRFEQFILS